MVRPEMRWKMYGHLKMRPTTFNSTHYIKMMDHTFSISAKASTSVPLEAVPQMYKAIKNMCDQIPKMSEGLIKNGAMSGKPWSTSLITFMEQNKFLTSEVTDQKTDDLVYRHEMVGVELSTPHSIIMTIIR